MVYAIVITFLNDVLRNMDLQSALSGKRVATKATATLRDDHRVIQELFEQHAAALAENSDVRFHVAEEIGMQIEVHTAVERDLFYPALQDRYREFVTHGQAQHRLMDPILKELRIKPSSPLQDPCIQALRKMFSEHIEEAERFFTQLEQDVPEQLEALQEQIGNRKEQLTGSVEDLEARS